MLDMNVEDYVKTKKSPLAMEPTWSCLVPHQF